MSGLFENGHGKTKRKLLLMRLWWGVSVMCLVQIQGYLPSLDFLSQKWLKILSFGMAVLLTVFKGMEMFYDKTVEMVDKQEISFDTETFKKPEDPAQPKP